MERGAATEPKLRYRSQGLLMAYSHGVPYLLSPLNIPDLHPIYQLIHFELLIY
jgi:hypothetical protein